MPRSCLPTMCLLIAVAMAVPVAAQDSGTRPGVPHSRPSQAHADPAPEPDPMTPARQPATRGDRDSLWQGALLGGVVGLGAGATVALLTDCSGNRRDTGCGSDRASLIAISTALGAGVGIGMDAIVGPEFTGAPLPGPPASERRVGLSPPSSRGAGLRFKLAW